jgi:hypothetical protein
MVSRWTILKEHMIASYMFLFLLDYTGCEWLR